MTVDAKDHRYGRKPRDAPPRLEARDLSVALGLPLLLIVAWTMPRSLWEPATRRLVETRRRLLPDNATGSASIARFLGGHLDSAEIVRLSSLSNRELRLAQLQSLRLLRPGARPPRTKVDGCEFLERALERRQGAVLWVAPTASGPLVSKLALHRAGYRLVHLSRFSHGFSGSVWGAGLANRLRTVVEDRYLARRVVIGANGATVGPLRVLAEALRGNAVVSISAGADGARTTTVPFLDGSIRLASGPVSLALSTGAALLPVFAAREDTGEVAATIGAPIDISSAPDRGQATVNAAGAFAGWLEGRALGTPGQIVWHYDMFRPPTLPTT